MRTFFNKKHCATLMLSIALLMSAQTAHAAKSDSATLTITGKVLDTTCTFNFDVTETLDDVADHAFRAVGDTAFVKDVPVSFMCGSDNTGVKISVAGAVNEDGTDSTAFKNTGSATGIALRLLADNGTTVLKPDGTSSTGIISLNSSQAGTYIFKAGYVKTADVVTPGSFTSVVNLSFNYN